MSIGTDKDPAIRQPVMPQGVFRHVSVGELLSDEQLARIPVTGPLVVVANGAVDALEGVLLASAIQRVRRDVKLLGSATANVAREVEPLLIRVPPRKRLGTNAGCLSALKESVQWVRRGGVLIVFPFSETGHFSSSRWPFTDQTWSVTVSRLILTTGACVLPFHVGGGSSLLFQLARLLPPAMSRKLVPNELLAKAVDGSTVRVGQLIDARKLAEKGSEAQVSDYLRVSLELLGSPRKPKATASDALGLGGETMTPVAEPVPRRLLASEIASLGSAQCLAKAGDLSVFLVDSENIPWVLREIGRLRELTFRATGEGTGKARDIDRYDAYYQHLFVWNHQADEIVGAYRLGLADEIMERFGRQGLYTSSLFRYRAQLLHALNPAIELGRSFVRPEYQRSFSPLMLLWKGIGRFIADNPRYTVLFGPVSISNEYETMSQQLMVEFLRMNTSERRLARLVRPRHPFRSPCRRDWRKRHAQFDLGVVSDLVASIESDQKGMPILLKQYLKLGGKILGFNIDPDFNDALDGLIMVDLLRADPKVLAKYMGREAAARFVQHATASARLSA